MPNSATISFSRKIALIKKWSVDGVLTVQDVDRIARFVILRELERTERGLDAQLATFAPYSEKWKKVRDSLGLVTSRVNLNFTNAMLNDLAFSVIQLATSNLEATIFFQNAEQAQKALWHIRGSDNLPKRDFHGIDSETAAAIGELIDAIIIEKLDAA